LLVLATDFEKFSRFFNLTGFMDPNDRTPPLLICLNRFFHLRKNRNQSNQFFAIFCDFFLGNQIRHREKTEEDCKDLLPSMGSLLGTVEGSK